MSGLASRTLRGRAACRRLCRLRAAGRHWRCRARRLLGAHTAQVLRSLRSHGLAHCGRGARTGSANSMSSRRACAVSRPFAVSRSDSPFPGRSSRPCAIETKRNCPGYQGALAEAVRYALSRWDGLTRFLHDGRIELDTNPVERRIRPMANPRKARSAALLLRQMRPSSRKREKDGERVSM
jgi:Transposase IS66 family